jgi:hypothetical protein
VRNVKLLSRRGIVIDLGPLELLDPGELIEAVDDLALDPARRQHMIMAGTSLVQGLVASRVV